MPRADVAGRRLLVLGAGRHQTALIRRAEDRGVAVVVSDYYPDAPGKAFATHVTDTDALDVAANIDVARSYDVDGVVTTGTDMAVVTMAIVADALDLPCYLAASAADAATNKVAMADAFSRHGVARARLVEVDDAAAAPAATAPLGFPVVVKPADSQGQRGTTKVIDPAQITEAVSLALDSSRAGVAVVEEFVAAPEITVSVWIDDAGPRILAVTDRVTYNPPPAIGIAVQHVFPSIHAAGRLDEVEAQVDAIAMAYGMTRGPLYIQMLVTPERVVVVEAGARVGGGHEASLIPLVTGVDVTDRLIDLALTGDCDPAGYDFADTADQRHALVNFLVARPGVVERLEGIDGMVDRGEIAEGSFYIAPGYEQRPIVDSLGRVGYFIASAGSRAELMALTRRVVDRVAIWTADGENLVFWPEAALLNG